MESRRAADEAEIRGRIRALAEAIRAMDLDAVSASYAPDIVSFDVASPSRDLGVEAKAKNWARAFAMFQRPLGYETRDLEISVGDDVAFAHGLNRLSGTSKEGRKNDLPWVRFTACFRKVDGNWLIVHDHVSVPLDPAAAGALVNVEP